MKLYDNDFHNLNEEDNKIWEELKQKEIVMVNGKLSPFKKSL